MTDRTRALPMSEADLHALVGHRFPGGTRTIEHWENWLLTDCTGRPTAGRRPRASDRAVPRADPGREHDDRRAVRVCSAPHGAPASVGLRRLRLGVLRTAAGGRRLPGRGLVPTSIERRRTRRHDGRLVIEMTTPEGATDGTCHEPLEVQPMSAAATAAVGDAIPPWTMTHVDPQRMKTMAALLRDPYPVHWDHEAVRAIGLGDRVDQPGPAQPVVRGQHVDGVAGPEQHPSVERSLHDPGVRGGPPRRSGTVTARRRRRRRAARHLLGHARSR